MTPPAEAWDPAQYNRFAAEREQPFRDLLSLLEPVEAARAVDLGCGDGRLTAALHRRLRCRSTVGVDTSDTMLERAAQHAAPDLRFERADIASWSGDGVDVVLSNAALQWAPDHSRVLARWRGGLAPGGQLAVQVPANADHATHLVSAALGREWFGDACPPDPVAVNVLRPERYAELLESLGFERQHVRLQVYGHRLQSSAELVEWVKGTSLTRFKVRLPEADYRLFLDEYRRRLLDAVGDRAPYFYAFKRILMWGRLGTA